MADWSQDWMGIETVSLAGKTVLLYSMYSICCAEFSFKYKNMISKQIITISLLIPIIKTVHKPDMLYKTMMCIAKEINDFA